MTPDQLAGQQLTAAWVSATAAVVQAAGAVAAIWFTGKLARESQKREDDAREAAAERERVAERNAERRAQKADQEASARDQRSAERRREEALLQAAQARNKAVRDAVELGERMLGLLNASLESYRSIKASGVLSQYPLGIQDRASANQIEAALGNLKTRGPVDPRLEIAISELMLTFDPLLRASGFSSADGQVERLEQSRPALVDAIAALGEQRAETGEVGDRLNAKRPEA